MSKSMLDIGCAQHQGKRETQEDAFGFSNLSDKVFMNHGGFLAIVADGMGGLAYGEEASNTAVRDFLGSYMSKKHNEDIPTSLLNSINISNEAVASLAQNKGTIGDTGSTIAAVVIHERRLYWVSVGDSKIYLYRKGDIYQINNEHNYLQELYKKVALNEITKHEAESNKHGKALTSFLGDLKDFDISHKYIKLHYGDTIIICTDGLSDTLNKRELIETIQKTNNAQKTAEELVNKVLDKDRPFQDNVTVLVVKILSEKINRYLKKKRWRIIILIALLLLLTLVVYLNFEDYLKAFNIR